MSRTGRGPTKLRGSILLHAGLRVDRDAMEDLSDVIAAVPEPRPKAHCGAVVGIARLVDCVPEESAPREQRGWITGPWCFVLDDVYAFAEPVPLKGALGFFDVPDEIVAGALRGAA